MTFVGKGHKDHRSTLPPDDQVYFRANSSLRNKVWHLKKPTKFTTFHTSYCGNTMGIHECDYVVSTRPAMDLLCGDCLRLWRNGEYAK